MATSLAIRVGSACAEPGIIRPRGAPTADGRPAHRPRRGRRSRRVRRAARSLRASGSRARAETPRRPRSGRGRDAGRIRRDLALRPDVRPVARARSAVALRRGAKRHHRRAPPHPRARGRARGRPGREPDPSDEAEASWTAWRVHRALEALPDHERPVIELAYWSGSVPERDRRPARSSSRHGEDANAERPRAPRGRRSTRSCDEPRLRRADRDRPRAGRARASRARARAARRSRPASRAPTDRGRSRSATPAARRPARDRCCARSRRFRAGRRPLVDSGRSVDFVVPMDATPAAPSARHRSRSSTSTTQATGRWSSPSRVLRPAGRSPVSSSGSLARASARRCAALSSQTPTDRLSCR